MRTAGMIGFRWKKSVRDWRCLWMSVNTQIPRSLLIGCARFGKGWKQALIYRIKRIWAAGVLEQLRKATLEHIDLSVYTNNGFDEDQLHQIRLAKKNGVDIDSYVIPDFRESRFVRFD